MSDPLADPPPATTIAELDRKLEHFAYRVEGAIAAVGADVDGLRREVVGVTDRLRGDVAEHGRQLVLLDGRVRTVESVNLTEMQRILTSYDERIRDAERELATVKAKQDRPGIPWGSIIGGGVGLLGVLIVVIQQVAH